MGAQQEEVRRQRADLEEKRRVLEELELEQLQEKEMLQQQERVAAEQQIAAFLRQQEQVERQMDAIAAEQRELRAQEQTMREALQQQRMAELRQQELLEEHLRLQQLLLLQQQQQQPSPPLPQLVTPFSALDAHTASVCVPQVSSDLYRTAGLGSVGFCRRLPSWRWLRGCCESRGGRTRTDRGSGWSGLD